MLQPHPEMPRPSQEGPGTHLSSLQWGRSGCYRPWRWWASGARSSPGLAGPLPGTARPWSARRPHSWPCTARNSHNGHPGLLGPGRPLFQTSPPPRLYRDCWEGDQTLIHPSCGQRGQYWRCNTLLRRPCLMNTRELERVCR